MKMIRSFIVVVMLLAGAACTFAQTALPEGSPWVFAGFKDNGQDGIYMALSLDGYHWTLANGGKPVVKPTETGELMRDPFLQRTPDDGFIMVWTWGWRGTSIGYSTSDDLLKWTPHQQLPVMASQPKALNAWAPAVYWDNGFKRWLLFWSSTIPSKFPGDDSGDGGLNHRIWSTTTRDFKKFANAKLYFDPGYSVIDATLFTTTSDIKGPKYHLIFKDERKTPLEKVLQTASSSDIEGPWGNISKPISDPWSEGAAVIAVPGGFLAYYDHYTAPQHYGALFSTDSKFWTDATAKISFPAGLRHGSFLQVSREEYEGLARLK